MTMQIKRDFYLGKLVERMHDGYVKVVTGIRRCGKSYLLNTLFREHLLSQGVRPSSIIQIALDDVAQVALRNPFQLSKHIRKQIKSEQTQYYVLIDEIQMCEEVPSEVEGVKSKVSFYDVLNGLIRMPNVDVYVTGSNSKMLSNDIATHFRDRSKVIRLHPLSFAEYFPVSGLSEYQAFNEYQVYGGLPECVLSSTALAKREYLDGLFNTLYLRDIVERNALKNELLLGRLVDFLMSAVGSLTNIRKIIDTLHSEQKVLCNAHTVQAYLTYLQQAYLVERADRYDVRGRQYFSYPSKYYAEDIGLRNARLNYRQTERTHLMENIIYNELRSRGAGVDVGVVPIKQCRDGEKTQGLHEIDFVVNLGMEKLYIQSAYNIDDPGKREAELLPLRKTGDSFRKLVVTGGDQPFYTDESGISFVGILPFLLDRSILDRMT
jgi:uncharacterized protein